MSRFRGTKDNSDSVKARLRQKGADKTNLQLLTRAENAWQALYDLRKRRERNINYCFIDQWSDWVYDEKGKLVRESSRIAKRTGGSLAEQPPHQDSSFFERTLQQAEYRASVLCT